MVLDLVTRTKKYKGELHEFFLDMKSWGKFKTKAKLTWQGVAFTPANQSTIPEERGIYVFSVEHRGAKVPVHGYILYVGITGDEDSEGNLRKRYGQYVRQRETGKGRPAVTYMLHNWTGHLSFYFCPVINPKVSLAEIETKFIDALIPPINKRDMSADITAVKAAAF
jgi:hypothetical protein